MGGIIIIILLLPAMLQGCVESPIAAFNLDMLGGSGDASDLDKRLYEHRDKYEKAAMKANKGLEGIAENYGLGWGVLAVLDIMANDNSYDGHEYAEQLKAYPEYKKVKSTTRIWVKMEDEDEGGDEDDKPSFDPSDGNYVFRFRYTLPKDCVVRTFMATIRKKGNEDHVFMKLGGGYASEVGKKFINIEWNGKTFGVLGRDGIPCEDGVYLCELVMLYETRLGIEPHKVIRENYGPIKVKLARGRNDLSCDVSGLAGAVGGTVEGEQDYNLKEFRLDKTKVEKETIVASVDTYKGLVELEYEKVIEFMVTGLDSSGNVIEVTESEKYALRKINYKPDWTRLQEALTFRCGKYELMDEKDVMFADEWGTKIERGVMDLRSLDSCQEGATGTYVGSKGYIWPVDGHFQITSGFGVYRNIPGVGVNGVHKGIDIAAPVGTNVLAVTDGIISAIYETVSGGYCLELSGFDDCIYLYVHLDHWASSYMGMQVDAGDIIAASGNTGKRTTGPHLHFESRVNGVSVDPVIHCGWDVVDN